MQVHQQQHQSSIQISPSQRQELLHQQNRTSKLQFTPSGQLPAVSTSQGAALTTGDLPGAVTSDKVTPGKGANNGRRIKEAKSYKNQDYMEKNVTTEVTLGGDRATQTSTVGDTMPTTMINSTMAMSTSVMHTCTGTLTMTMAVISSSTSITDDTCTKGKRKNIPENSESKLAKRWNIDASNQTEAATDTASSQAENLSSE